jgi:uncharacterized protein (TIGR02302 family)
LPDHRQEKTVTIDKTGRTGSNRTGRGKPGPRTPFAERIALARAALAWEVFWPSFWPVAGIAGLFLSLALFEVLPLLPGWLHVAVLGLFAVGLLLALGRALRPLRLPTSEEARRRIEQDSGLEHRPLGALDDRLATDSRDRAAAALWEAHRRRLLAQAARLTVKLPRAGLAKIDPIALRSAVFLLLAIAVTTGAHDWRPRLIEAFTPRFGPALAGPPARLDAWINPPAYTALPPLFLAAETREDKTIQAPVGSTVLAQVQGQGGVPQLHLGQTSEDFTPVTAGVYEIKHPLETGERLAITQDGATLAEWPLEILPDTPPEIEFISPPGRTERSALRLAYAARDDYGLNQVALEIARIDQPDGEPLRLDLPLPATGLREAESASYHDLTPHPWAGIAVTLRLVATDALGQTGESDPVRTVLPERIFNHPVARALVELRKQLTLAPDKRFPVIRGLSDLNRHPEHFYHDIVVALTIRSAERRLLYDGSDAAIGQVQQLMWDTALRIEEGDLAIAERDLRKIQEELMRALAENAPDEEIERLLDQLQEALDRFLEALAEQLSEQLAEGLEPEPLPPNAQIMQSEDLRQLLDKARELARSGAREAARELLAQLQNMLENLRANPFAQSLGEDGQSAWEMLRDMESLMQRQQELLDRSYRRAQEEGQQPGERGRQGQDLPKRGQSQSNENQRDAQAQDGIRRELGEMMRRLGQALGDIPRPLGRAEQAMRDARDALGREQPGEAIDPQSRALDQLQQGLQAMAESFMERMGEGQPMQGSGSVGMGPGFGRDPLGRNSGDSGLEALEGVRLPDQMELRRSREILRELRRRRGEPSRPPVELDYIDRLLRQF